MRLPVLILTRDEILTFLTIIGSTTMNGLDENPVAGLEEREIAERFNSGEQSLINRGLLDLTKPAEAMLDDTLVALVGSSAMPDATFLLTRVNPDGSNDPHYFNATPELLVEHHSPRAGIHQFGYLPGLESLKERVHDLLSSATSTDDLTQDIDVRIDSASLDRFVELIQEKSLDRAHSTLTEAGVSTSVASSLLEDYITYPSWVGLAAWNLRTQGTHNSETIMVIGGDRRCWLLENMTEQSNQVRLRQASRNDCWGAMTHLLQPIKQIYQPSR